MLVRQALAQSLNIPAVKTLEFVGLPGFLDKAQRMGITTLDRPNDYGLSLTLGGGDVTLLEMTGAFAVFANGGRRVPPVAILRIEDSAGNVIEEYQAAGGRAGGQPAARLPDHRHPGRQPGPRADVRGEQRAQAVAAGRGQDRHHRRLSRRLDRRLHARAGGRGVGRQRRQHADEKPGRLARRSADLAQLYGKGPGRHVAPPVRPAGRDRGDRDQPRRRIAAQPGLPGRPEAQGDLCRRPGAAGAGVRLSPDGAHRHLDQCPGNRVLPARTSSRNATFSTCPVPMARNGPPITASPSRRPSCVRCTSGRAR